MPVLIAVPANLLKNWEAEAKQWLGPDALIQIVTIATKETAALHAATNVLRQELQAANEARAEEVSRLEAACAALTQRAESAEALLEETRAKAEAQREADVAEIARLHAALHTESDARHVASAELSQRKV